MPDQYGEFVDTNSEYFVPICTLAVGCADPFRLCGQAHSRIVSRVFESLDLHLAHQAWQDPQGLGWTSRMYCTHTGTVNTYSTTVDFSEQIIAISSWPKEPKGGKPAQYTTGKYANTQTRKQANRANWAKVRKKQIKS